MLSLLAVLSTLCLAGGALHAVPEALVLAYPMAAGEGDVLRDAVSARDAAITGGEWVTNRNRPALRFDGKSTVAMLEDSALIPLGVAFSVDVWYNASRAHDPVALVVKPRTFRLLLYPAGRKFLVEVSDESGRRIYGMAEGPVKRRVWQHVALVYAPDAGAKLFLDGQEVFADVTELGPLALANGPLRIGLGVNPEQRRYFKGMMAGVRLWNKALSQEEIGKIMQNDKPALESTFRGADDLQPKLPAAQPIGVADRKQLFIDERFIEVNKEIQLRMNPPQKLGLLLRPEKPWENKSFGFCASVLEHDGLYKLFYETWSTGGTSVCLATSTDGLHWERPSLGIIEFGGSKDNNIVYRGVGESVVFLDPHGKEDERFKLISVQNWPDPETCGLYCNTSPDGLHWKPGPRVLPLGPDTANQAAWDQQRGKYVAYLRKWDPLRKFGRIETDDIMKPWPFTDLGDDAYFIWGKDKIPVPSREMPTAFGYDDQDPVESDHYNPAVVEYPWAERAYFSFPSAYLHFPPPPGGKYANDGLLDIQLAVSRDGLEFHRIERSPYIPLGLAGEPDSLSNYMAVGMIRVGDYLYQYYGAYDVTHGLPEGEQDLPIGSFCAARQRLDGFVSADAPYAGGEFITPPITFTGDRLVLNINTSAMGLCQVGILDAEGEPIVGFEADACDEIHGNFIARTVSWNGETNLSQLAGKPIRLHFMMRAAKLFAFQFGGE